MIILLFILLIGITFIGGGYYFARIMVYPRVHPSRYTYDHELEEGKIAEPEFSNLPKQEIHLHSPFGYDLFGLYIPQAGSTKTVVLAHGITWSLYGMVKYMWMFWRRGFNLLLYDHRNHGRSGGSNTTFGFYEKHDLKVMVDWAFAQLPAGGTVGTMGESLGAATALQEAALDPRLSFVVADCPFSDFEALVKFRKSRDYPFLPDFPLLQIASWFAHLLTGFRPSDAVPAKGIPHIKTPILFCHGQQDAYIPPQMSVDMHNAKKQGISRLYLAPNAKHAQALWNNQQEYDRVVGEFLEEVYKSG